MTTKEALYAIANACSRATTLADESRHRPELLAEAERQAGIAEALCREIGAGPGPSTVDNGQACRDTEDALLAVRQRRDAMRGTRSDWWR